MDTLILEKSGPLTGTIEVNGSKNSSLPIMAACLLTEDEVVLEGVPQVTDVLTMVEILRTLGAQAVWEDHRLVIRPGAYAGWTAPYELVSRMRA